MTGPIRNTIDERQYDSFIESPTRANKTAVEIVGIVSASSFGSLQPPVGTDYISNDMSDTVQTVIYKTGGASGTILKTITITYVGCNFTLVIS